MESASTSAPDEDSISIDVLKPEVTENDEVVKEEPCSKENLDLQIHTEEVEMEKFNQVC